MSGLDVRLITIGCMAAIVAVAGCDKQETPPAPNFQSTFEVPPIEVTSFTPGEGLAGDMIQVTGIGFDETHRAYVGGAGVEVLSATDSTMTLRLPEWASSGAVRVTDNLGWRSGTSAAVFDVKTPTGLTMGYNGSGSQPGITSGESDMQTVDASATTTTVSGTVTGNEGDGYWAIVETDGTVRSMGRLTVSGGAYSQTVPIFCGTQDIIRFFSNTDGRAYYRTQLTRTGCTEANIRVQLAWDTDGTDVDLHLIKPDGNYNDSFSDCYFANSNPDWGMTGDASDDPELDVDDVNGFGPENIYLDPSEDGTYAVTVHYWSDHGNGPSNAWLEIYIDGQRGGTMGPYFLNGTGSIWRAAEIAWPSGDVSIPE